jgi:Family of unknown function (DUF6232)
VQWEIFMNHDDPETIVMNIRPGLQISQTCLQVGSRHYELDTLSDLQTRHSAFDPLTKQAALLAALGAVVLAGLWEFMQPAGRMLTGAVLFGLVVLTLISLRLRPRRLELWAMRRGRPTQLFASDDWWVFAAVERQLHRSINESRLGLVAVRRMARPASAVPHPSAMHPSKIHPGNS